MHRSLNIFILVLLVLALFTPNASALTVIQGGEVNGIWTVADHPYLISGEISISTADSLIIQPGVEVRFNSGMYLNVFGTLLALGTPDDSIKFIANTGTIGDWRSLKFDGIRANNSRMDYCIVQHTERGLHVYNCYPEITNSRISDHETYCLRLESSRSNFTNCNIANSQGSGVLIAERSDVAIRHSRITGCADVGVHVIGASDAVIDHVEFPRAIDHAIYLSSAGVCSLSYNRFIDCTLNAIRVDQTDRVTIYRNIIYGARGDYGIYCYRSNSSMVTNNTIYQCSTTGIGAITCQNIKINGNIIAFNGQDGIYAQRANLDISYNDLWQNSRDDYGGEAGEGRHELNEAPGLVNPGRGDFRPQQGSPLIDRGDPRIRDLDGTLSDIGAEFYNQNIPPQIISVSPEEIDVVPGDEEFEFMVSARDANEHNLFYHWYINDELQVQAVDSVFTHTFERDGDYTVKVVVDDRYYYGTTPHEWEFTVQGADVEDGDVAGPRVFALNSVYPNPFNKSANISITLPQTQHTNVKIVDLNGRLVQTVFEGSLTAGEHTLSVNNLETSTGMYLVIAETKNSSISKKLILLK